MRTVRTCVFETNSSSIHVISMCKESVYKDFFDKHIGLWSDDRERIMTYAEVCQDLKDNYKQDYYYKYFVEDCAKDYVADPEKIFTVQNLAKVVKDHDGNIHNAYSELELENGIDNDEAALLYWLSEDFRTADEFAEQDWIEESFEDEYTTESGEKIIAFGYYGRG